MEEIMLLKSGLIDIEIPYKNKLVYLDSLNEGSCFCCYSPFAQEEDQQVQFVSFKARTDCIVETFHVDEIKKLSKRYLQLSDILKQLQIEIKNEEKTELDFFRYCQKREFPPEIRRLIKLKFKAAVLSFTKSFRAGKIR